MAFDLSSVINQAQEVTSQQQDGGGKDRVRLIYPGAGTLKVKLLYNPKSNLVARQIKRHKVGNTNYTCLSMYGMDCPICKTVDSIKNSTGLDLWKYNAKNRGLTYAQYVGSDRYSWDNDNKEPQVGELVLLMYPWTIYQDINRVISSAGTRASELIASNCGKIVNVVRWRENSQEKYKCEVEAFAQDFQSCADDSEFEKFLNDLPDLNEAIVPSVASQDTVKAANEAAEALSREYLRGTQYGGMPGMSPQQTQMSGGSPNIIDDGQGHQFILINGQYVPVNQNAATPQTPPPQQLGGFTPGFVSNPVPPQNALPPQINTPQENVAPLPPYMNPPQATAAPNPAQIDPPSTVGQSPTTADGKSMPECFGKHKDGDPKCLSCIMEVQCMTCS